jgi:tetratricopeptide (TPR) repeat protein
MAVRRSPGASDLATFVGGAALLAAAGLRPRRDAATAARLVALLVGAGAAVAALAQRLAGARGLGVHGGQGNPNWLGLLLAVSLPLSLSAAARARTRGRAALAVAIAGVLVQLAALVVAQSRTAVAALAVAALAVLIAHAAASRSGRALSLRLAAAIALVATAALLIHAGALGSLAGRIWIWKLSACAAADAFPWGDGLGRFPGAFLAEQGQALAAVSAGAAARQFVNATTAHNDWLQTAVETGLPGLITLAAALAIALRACWRGGARAEAATILAFAVSAAGDSPMRQPAALALLVLAVASAPRPTEPPLGAPARPTAVPARALRAAGLLAAAVLLSSAVSTWAGARLTSAARDADPDRQHALLSRAAALDPDSAEIAFALGVAALARGAPEAASFHFRVSGALLPQVGTDVALGNALLAEGDPGASVDAYERALRRNPGSFRAHANLVTALRRLGRDDEAAWHLRVARRLLPAHPALHEL